MNRVEREGLPWKRVCGRRELLEWLPRPLPVGAWDPLALRQSMVLEVAREGIEMPRRRLGSVVLTRGLVRAYFAGLDPARLP